MIGKPTQEKFTSNEANDLWCDQKCVNTNGSFVCDCEKGYYLQYNNQSCSGINVIFEAIHQKRKLHV